MKQLITAVALLAISIASYAQSTAGSLKGTVKGSDGDLLPSATVSVEVGENKIHTLTDMDGQFTIKPLDPGTYVAEISFTSFETQRIRFEIEPDRITFLDNIVMTEADSIMGEIIITEYRNPLIDKDEPNKLTMGVDEIKHSAAIRNVPLMIKSMSSDIKMSESGELYFRGSRSDGVVTFIDGVKQSSTVVNLPGRAIGSVSVYTGGIPAKYGDTTSGIVVMETMSYFQLYNSRNN